MKSSFHSLIAFSPLFCNCQLSSSPLLPSSYPGRLASRNSTNSSQSVYRQSVHFEDKPHETQDQNFISKLKTCCYSPYVTSFLTRGRVCRLQLLLALACAVILGSESREAHDHILFSHIRDSPNLEGQVHVFI
jgi:hypothetical protein